MAKYGFFLLFLLTGICLRAQVPTLGLVGEWLFSGNANDGSLSANNGTVFGATLTYDRCGNANSAYSFNGTTNYIQMLTTGPTGNASRSLSFWAKTTNTVINSPRSSFDYGTALGAGDSYQIVWNYCGNGVGLDVSNQALIRGNICLENNAWHHIAIIYDNSISNIYSNVSFYIDNVLQGVISCNVSGTNATINTGLVFPITVGRGATSAVRYFAGDLDDIRLYNRALTAAEVQQLYTPCAPPLFGSTPVCPGSVNVYSVAPITNATYTWTLPGGWSGVSTTNTISATAGLNGGVISVVASSTCGVFPTSTMAVTTLSLPLLNVASSNSLLCAGSTATLTVSGAPTYTWVSPVSTNFSITVSPPATAVYTVKASAANGCATSATYTQVVVTNPTITASSTGSLPCIGRTATLTASGGLTYTWQPFNVVSPTIAVSPGTTSIYTVTGQLSGGCSSFTTIMVPVPSSLNLVITPGSPTACPSQSITLTASNSGGNPGYTYTWTAGPVNSNTYLISQAVAGIYGYTVSSRDANACLSTKTISVQYYGKPFISIPTVSVCPGTTATLTAFGALTYTWFPGQFAVNPFTVAPVANSSYTVIGTSAIGCTASASTSVTIYSLPLPAFNTFSITCGNLGSATVTAAGGTGPYNYSWTPIQQTGSVATGLYPGNYTVTIFDLGSGCLLTPTINFSPLVPMTGTLSATASLVCNGANTASASISLSGGSGSQTYSWTSPSGVQSTPEAASLGAGIHTVQVTDGLTFCTVTQTFQITQPPAFTLAIAASSPSVCLGGSISLTAFNMGGTPGYTYQWVSGPSLNTYTVTEPAGGTYVYSLTSTDANSCTVTSSISVKFVTLPLVTSTDGTVCAGSFVTLTASGAAGYTWYPTNYAGSMHQVAPASNTTYTIVGSTAGCTSTAVSSVTVHALPTVTVSNNSPVCSKSPLSLNALGSAAYFYKWTGPNGFLSLSQNTVIISTAPGNGGMYTMSVSTSDGCSVLATTMATILPLPLAWASGAGVCAGESSTITASGGVSYTWTGPGGYSANGSSAGIPVVNNTTAGIYTVSVAGSNSCVAQATAEVIAYPFPLPVPMVNSPVQGCLNSNIVLKGSGGTYYLWKGPNNFVSTNAEVAMTANNMALSGIYTLTVKNASNCAATNTLQLTIFQLPYFSLSSTRNNLCAPFCTELKAKPLSKNPAPISAIYLDNAGSYFSDSITTYCLKIPGQQTILARAIDTNNCISNFSISLNAYPKPEANFDFYPLDPSTADAVKFHNHSVSAGTTRWNWLFIGNATDTVHDFEPGHVFESQGVYQTVLIAQNSWGCSDTAIKYVAVNDEVTFYVPNSFTPDGDNLNDVFQPKGVGIAAYELDIFDRWGLHLFGSSDFFTGWDGSFKGKPCKSDSYVWMITTTDTWGRKKSYNGSVTLIR